MLAPAVRHRTQVPTVRSSSLSSGDHRRTNNGTESTCHTTKSSIWAWTTTTSPGFGPSTVPRPGNASESGCWTEHCVNSHGQSKGVASRRMIRQAGENVPASLKKQASAIRFRSQPCWERIRVRLRTGQLTRDDGLGGSVARLEHNNTRLTHVTLSVGFPACVVFVILSAV